MNAVEKLEAAIAKLEGLRDQAGFAPWCAWKVRGDTGRMAYGIEDAYGEDIATIRSGPETELIEILHRTVGMQLAILRIGVQFAQITPNRYTDAAVDLATAILGVSDADVG